MAITTLPSAQEFEEKGHADIEFVGFRYVGDDSIKTDHDLRSRIGYDGSPKFQRGSVYLALLPTWLDESHVTNANIGVAALEARNDFEVIYDAPRLAEALLSKNYLPPDVFYEGFDRWKRQKVLEKLDLEDTGRVFDVDDEEPYREQLREIAGVEAGDAAEVSTRRAEEYANRLSRRDAQAVATELQERDTIDVDPDAEPPFDPSEFTIDELDAELETDADEKWDVGSLRALLAAERAGKHRSGAVDVIESGLADPSPTEVEIDTETAGLTDMAEFMTRFDPDVVEDAIDVALGE